MARALILSGLTILCMAIATTSPVATAQQADAFVGANSCQDCHMDYYESWSKTKHSRALDKLTGRNRSSGECIECHVTDTPEMLAATDDTPKFPNVQCEACHGAGRAHVEAAKAGKAAAVKTSPADEQTCRRCHNLRSPNYKTFVYSALSGLVHPTR